MGSGPDLPAGLDGWVPTRALGRAVLVAGVLVFLAALTGRYDLVVLAAPFALGTALSLRRRPESLPAPELSTMDARIVEGDDFALRVSVANADPVPLDLVVLRLALPRWVRVDRGDHPYAAAVPSGSVAEVDLAGTALRWGRHDLGPLAVHGVACDGLLASLRVECEALPVKAYPSTDPFRADEALPRAAGLVGQHRSRRSGEGGELAGVRQFAPGDRLRRIDWRVTLRTRRVHVVSTLSDRDAEVVLLLDVLHEAGESGGTGGAASVMDTTVRAAAGIAEHYLHRGDRVAMLEYGSAARRLRPASGHRQYLTVLEWLLDAQPSGGAYEPDTGAFGAHLLSTNALVIVLTPLLDQRSAAMVAGLARSGRVVVAVDTLPPDLRPPADGPWMPLAHRLWRMSRENVVGLLREHGVPVVAWAGAGSLDQVLRDVTRMATASSAGRR
ncbi:DUF58 domain-containing protein [Planosporangium sp. 12N6]|uniref:DUF58 domain-containing protein n=1 Tax=Planosporangium spinosum TaxID=3402278 RepID=UPI003CF3716B